jgi:hypothetical protein
VCAETAHRVARRFPDRARSRGVTAACLTVLIACLGALAADTRGTQDTWDPADAAVRQTLYVAPAGDDDAPGTAGRPLRTLQRAADLAIPGTTVRVARGVYRPVVSRAGGTASARIVYRSETRWEARIESRDDTAPWDNLGDHVDIVGFDVTAPRARLGLVSEGSHVRFLHNRVHEVAKSSPCGSGGGAAIDHAGYSGRANEITGNWVQDIGPEGGCNTIQGVYVSQRDGIIRDNTVSRVSGWCIHTWHAATDVRISGNLAMSCGVARVGSGGGILVGAGDAPPGVYASNFVVTDNVVLDSYRGIVEGGRVGPGNRFSGNTLVRITEPGPLPRGARQAAPPAGSPRGGGGTAAR